MTKEQAQQITHLDLRDMGEECTNPWLRFQLGTIKPVKVQTSPYKYVNTTIYVLKAFGGDWATAVEMWEERQKQ